MAYMNPLLLKGQSSYLALEMVDANSHEGEYLTLLSPADRQIVLIHVLKSLSAACKSLVPPYRGRLDRLAPPESEFESMVTDNTFDAGSPLPASPTAW